MKFRVIEGQPKFRITLTAEEAGWLHAILDGFESPDEDEIPEELKLVDFIETLRRDLDEALFTENCDVPAFKDCFGDAPEYVLAGDKESAS